jgi:hypothetical protein
LVEGIGEELVDLQGLVFLVRGPAVGQGALEVLRAHSPGHLPVDLGGAIHGAEEDHGGVLQALHLLGGEEEGRAQGLAGPLLVLVPEGHHRHLGALADPPLQLLQELGRRRVEDHPPLPLPLGLHQVGALPVHGTEAGLLEPEEAVGELGDLAGVAVVGLEDGDALQGLGVLPEEVAFKGRPAEEVGVDDLVAVPGEEKGTLGLEAPEE